MNKRNYDEDNSNATIEDTNIDHEDNNENKKQTEINLEEDDSLELHEQLNNIAIAEEEDFEFHHIHSYKWEGGVLMFTIELSSGKCLEIPFNLIKKDRPMETARYIRNNVVEKTRSGYYGTWAKNILKQADRNIRRIKWCYNIYRIVRINPEIKITTKRLSQNKRNQQSKKRMKFEISISNSVREALILDTKNKNNLWAEAIKKEMTALDNTGVFQYKSPNYKIP